MVHHDFGLSGFPFNLFCFEDHRFQVGKERELKTHNQWKEAFKSAIYTGMAGMLVKDIARNLGFSAYSAFVNTPIISFNNEIIPKDPASTVTGSCNHVNGSRAGSSTRDLWNIS